MAAIHAGMVNERAGEDLFLRLVNLDPKFVRDDYFSSENGWDMSAMKADIVELEAHDVKHAEQMFRQLCALKPELGFKTSDYHSGSHWDVTGLRTDLRVMKAEQASDTTQKFTSLDEEDTSSRTVETEYGTGVIVDTCGPSGFVIELMGCGATVYAPMGIPTRQCDDGVGDILLRQADEVAAAVAPAAWEANMDEMMANVADEHDDMMRQILAERPNMDEPMGPWATVVDEPQPVSPVAVKPAVELMSLYRKISADVQKRKRKRTPAKKAVSTPKKKTKRSAKKASVKKAAKKAAPKMATPAKKTRAKTPAKKVKTPAKKAAAKAKTPAKKAVRKTSVKKALVKKAAAKAKAVKKVSKTTKKSTKKTPAKKTVKKSVKKAPAKAKVAKKSKKVKVSKKSVKKTKKATKAKKAPVKAKKVVKKKAARLAAAAKATKKKASKAVKKTKGRKTKTAKKQKGRGRKN